MNAPAATDILQAILYPALLPLLAVPLGVMMARVFSGTPFPGERRLGIPERAIHRLSRIDPSREMRWTEYLTALFAFNLTGLLSVTALLMVQHMLPLNPARLPGVPFALALNTAVSFVTNTNWQAYAGESALSPLSQMAGLAVQNFVSAATGLAVAVALARGVVRKNAETLGNFWSDLVRGTLYILLPLSIVFSVVLVQQGVVQDFRATAPVTAGPAAGSVIPLGPAASQVAIKQLGTNGGGFFGVNSAHPFENPTPWTNALELLAILLLPAACVVMYGRLTQARRDARAVFAVMLLLLVMGLAAGMIAEWSRNAALGGVPSLEGKEARIGVTGSVLWAVFTTAASNGSVNAMHSSLSPLGGLVPMVLMQIGEVVFGGVGSGMYGMIAFVILTVFIAGLMVGRTPEYLGKKIHAFDVRMAVIAVLAPTLMVMLGTVVGLATGAGRASLLHGGPHGVSEVVYAFSSAANNNGSAFGGLNANTPLYNLATAAAMLVGRFAIIAAMLALAGNLGRKTTVARSVGTFPTDGPLFVTLLLGVILIVGILTFLPVLTLGPILEHGLLAAGRFL